MSHPALGLISRFIVLSVCSPGLFAIVLSFKILPDATPGLIRRVPAGRVHFLAASLPVPAAPRFWLAAMSQAAAWERVRHSCRFAPSAAAGRNLPAGLRFALASGPEIGRASCRERV